MLSELKSISSQMSHQGEKGRNNEAILLKFLAGHLPTRYTVSTGKVVGVGNRESGQVDIIVHDRLHTPALVDSHAWSLVPVESVYGVISVKSSLNKNELRSAVDSIQSVRKLPRFAAKFQNGSEFLHVPESDVLRPRGLVFAFESKWSSLEACAEAFVDVIGPMDDHNRPNAVCVLDQGFLIRKPFSTELIKFSDFALMHFFMFLVRAMETRPSYSVDLSRYFTDDYGLGNGTKKSAEKKK